MLPLICESEFVSLICFMVVDKDLKLRVLKIAQVKAGIMNNSICAHVQQYVQYMLILEYIISLFFYRLRISYRGSN
jgi:hypothetical protein